MSQGRSRLVGGAAVEEAVATVRAKILLVAAITLLGLVVGIVVGAGKNPPQELEMRVKLSPIGANGTAVSLGVSTPRGPLAADFVSAEVLNPLAKRLGRSRSQLEGEIGLRGVAGAAEQLFMVVSGDDAAARKLLFAWYAQVQRSQRAAVALALRQTKEAYVEELNEIEPLRSRQDALENIARLTGLSGSLRTTVSILDEPEATQVASRSLAFYVIVGLAAGLIGGLAIALGIGLLERKLRTPAALSAQFGLPIVADLRDDGGAEDQASLLERMKIAVHGEPSELLVVEAGPQGSATDAAGRLKQIPSPLGVGPIGSAEALAGVGSGAPWVVAVRPGATRTDQAADLRGELSRLPTVPLGLVLV